VHVTDPSGLASALQAQLQGKPGGTSYTVALQNTANFNGHRPGDRERAAPSRAPRARDCAPTPSPRPQAGIHATCSPTRAGTSPRRRGSSTL
jgi:hypothetical protein